MQDSVKVSKSYLQFLECDFQTILESLSTRQIFLFME